MMETRDTHPPVQETAEQIKATAEAWFRRQVELLRMAHGSSWDEHKAWVVDYLRGEARQRLLARGWRPRDGS